ncbi:hypothetical protein ARMGADRAFT_1158377 [Armillaria gallica]|uniref:Uncharacterized protein n=1 Tax=Armillaria gallica TaxID=47427 RepID=A0A2H3EPC8_ARMGA|nr:hypothetical protein ARMGADRAFT_1158377 [Armillaria gallica]
MPVRPSYFPSSARPPLPPPDLIPDSTSIERLFFIRIVESDTSRLVAATVLDELHAAISASGENFLLEQVGSMSFSIMPRSEKQDPEHRKKLAYVLPEYLGGEQLN